jgi:hypothetical protein
MTAKAFDKHDFNIYPTSTTEQMVEHLRAWANAEQKRGATMRAMSWRAVADRLEELGARSEIEVRT